MFNIKTSDKVPSGYIFCIKEVALGNSHPPPTRKRWRAAPDGYRHPGSVCQGGQREGRPWGQHTHACDHATEPRSPRRTCPFTGRHRPPRYSEGRVICLHWTGARRSPPTCRLPHHSCFPQQRAGQQSRAGDLVTAVPTEPRVPRTQKAWRSRPVVEHCILRGQTARAPSPVLLLPCWVTWDKMLRLSESQLLLPLTWLTKVGAYLF